MQGNHGISVFESLWLFIVSTSAASVVLLALDRFHSTYAVIAGAVICLVLAKAFSLRLDIRGRGVDGALLIILLIGFLFRAEPYLYVPGGQDQGLYVNMSAAYERTGSTFITDTVRTGIGDPVLREYYDTHNQSRPDEISVYSLVPFVENRFEGYHLPGAYIEDLDASRYVFQFYPLHPLWMAIAAKLLGPDNRVYSLVIFSLLSIVSFYLLALELSGGRRAPAHLIAFFIAVNPLHAFFSKFPVSEIMALAFSSTGFYFLAKYYRMREEPRPLYLFLSAGALACMFFTRISGFLYLPFFFFLFAAILLLAERGRAKAHLVAYCLSVSALYGLSVLYGLDYSYPYSLYIYTTSFPGTPAVLLGVVLAFALLLLLIALAPRSLKHAFASRLMRRAPGVLPYVVGAVILAGAVNAYLLGYTGVYGGHWWVDTWWGLAGKGWKSLLYSNLYVAALYLTPGGFLAFLLSLRHAGKQEGVFYPALLSFLAMFWAYCTIFLFTPRQFFHARYLVSELVPYSLLLVSLYLGRLLEETRARRLVAWAFFVMISLFSLSYTRYQFLGKEADGADEALRKIARHMDRRDLLLINRYGFDPHAEVKTALSYYYGLSVFSIRDVYDLDGRFVELFSESYGDVFLLSQGPLAVPFAIPLDTIAYRRGRFKEMTGVPDEFSHFQRNLYLYRVDATRMAPPGAMTVPPLGVAFDIGSTDEGRLRLEGFSGKETSSGESRTFRWAAGRKSRIVFRGIVPEKTGPVAVRFTVIPFAVNVNKKMVLESSLSSAVVTLAPGWSEYNVILKFPAGEDIVLEVRYEESASPASLGMRDDGRDLSVAWDSVSLRYAEDP